MLLPLLLFFFFFFNDTATTEIYTLSLHDALPICPFGRANLAAGEAGPKLGEQGPVGVAVAVRSEEHTSELQSRLHLVCRLLLEKKKKKKNSHGTSTVELECGHLTLSWCYHCTLSL